MLVSSLGLFLFYSCAVKPSSEFDNPQYHHKAGMRNIEGGRYEDAIRSFERAIALDKKFAKAHAGLAISFSLKKEKKEAKKYISRAQSLSPKSAEVLTLCGRAWICLRGQDKKWGKESEKLLKKALKREKKYEPAIYYLGEMFLYRHEFSEAESQFRKTVEMKGKYSGKADEMWQKSQKIVRAVPGTSIGKKIAIEEKITRADFAALLAEELKISVLIERRTDPVSGFQTPNQVQESVERNTGPPDSKGHWAETWIKEISRFGILEGSYNQNFYPNDWLKRAEYCMAIQRVLTIISGDESLETRYFGESPSRFQDVSSSHPAYNAMALCAERGIMQSNMLTGKFEPSKPVSGADALLSIRSFQNALKINF